MNSKTKKTKVIDLIGQPIEVGQYVRLRIACRGTAHAGNIVSHPNANTRLTVGAVGKVMSVANHGGNFNTDTANGIMNAAPIRNIMVQLKGGVNVNLYDNCLEPLEITADMVRRKATALQERGKLLGDLEKIIIDKNFTTESLNTVKSAYLVKRILEMDKEQPEKQSRVIEELMETDFAEVIFAD